MIVRAISSEPPVHWRVIAGWYTAHVSTDAAVLPVIALVGRVVRETRIGLGWSQRELSRRSGVPQSQISLLERQRNTDLRLVDIDRILVALGVGYRLVLDPPFIERRIQADLVHAHSSAHVDRRMRTGGWLLAREVEVGGDRSRGWIDLLAFDPRRRWLLVIEIKTEIHDVGAIERSMNWYEREARAAARRFGWAPVGISAALLILQSDANERAIAVNRELLATAFPTRADALLQAIEGAGEPVAGRALAMLDPRSRRRRWLRGSRSDGRRSAAPYADYIDAARKIETGSGRRLNRVG